MNTFAGQKDTYALFMEHHADVNAKNTTGYTPLHHAASEGQAEICILLLQHGANIHLAYERDGRDGG